eukprot:UN01956
MGQESQSCVVVVFIMLKIFFVLLILFWVLV